MTDFTSFDGIIFDVDGTLWDSTDPVAVSYNIVFEREGMSYRTTGPELMKLFGKPMDVIFANLFPELPRSETDRLANDCIIEENHYLEEHPADFYPGIYKTMEALSKKYPLFIVSNCQCGYIEIVEKAGGLTPFIKDHLCFGDTGTSKGQTLLRLMRENGLKNPIYVGDTQGDMDACKEAGIPMILCNYGFGHTDEAIAAIDTFGELTTLFEA